METQIFAIKLLSPEEAWDLFKEKAGDCVVNADIDLIAREVSHECGGLPLAIVTVASALKKQGKHAWEDALEQLKKSSVTCIRGMELVYSRLKLSYDNLKENPSSARNEECNQLQRLFLLCCLFPEDSDISIELLFRFFMGLRFFSDDQHLESAKNRVQWLTDQLRSCYLLLPSDKEGHVKVHDVVRDFGLKEASSGAHVYFSRHDGQLEEWPLDNKKNLYTAISIGSQNNLELPPGLDYPLLQLLHLSGGGSIQLSRDNFIAMKELRVVFLESKSVGFHYENMSIESPPKTLEFFMSVQTLCLENCDFSTDIRLIGSMHNLKVLSFYDCKIDVLPIEIGQLSNLKLLDLRTSNKLNSIVPGVLSRLTKLEDLYMGYYFHVSKTEKSDQAKHASITELSSLSGLKTLQVCVAEEEDLLKIKDFPFGMLKRFDISIYGSLSFFGHKFVFLGQLELTNLDLNLFQGTEFPGLLRRAEIVELRNVSGLKNNMWRGPVQSPSLVNLKAVYIIDCKEIVNLFSRSAARCLVKLETLRVSNCEKLKEIVSSDDGREDENVDTKMIEFPKLKEVRIYHLPSFKCFIAADSNNNSNGSIFNDQVLLPSIEQLNLLNVRVVKLVLYGKMLLHKLRRLFLRYCDMISCVVAFEEIKLLHNLERIRVVGGDKTSVEALFDLEGADVVNEDGSKVMVLEQLSEIDIIVLAELTHLFKNVPKQGFQGFQKLKKLSLFRCSKIKYLLSVSMAGLLVNLEVIYLKQCKLMEEVIKMDDEKEKEGITKKMDKIVFPQLRQLNLDDVGLKVFCQGNLDLEFPALEKVSIVGCSNMNNFCSGSLTTPQLKSVVYENESVWMGDLNKTIQHIYESRRKD